MSDAPSKYAPVPGKIPGRALNMGGRELVLAPLTLDQVQEFEPTMTRLADSSKPLREMLADFLPVILASLQRNYPDITLEDVRALVDVGNFKEATEAIVDISGYKRVAPGETLPAAP